MAYSRPCFLPRAFAKWLTLRTGSNSVHPRSLSFISNGVIITLYLAFTEMEECVNHSRLSSLPLQICLGTEIMLYI